MDPTPSAALPSKSHSGKALAAQKWQPRRPKFETTNADIYTYDIDSWRLHTHTSTYINPYPHIPHKRTQTKMIGQGFIGGSIYRSLSRAGYKSRLLVLNQGPPLQRFLPAGKMPLERGALVRCKKPRFVPSSRERAVNRGGEGGEGGRMVEGRG